MKYLKKLTLNESDGIRKAGNEIFIDGINEESHFLFPVIESLNNILQQGNISIDDIMEGLDNALEICNNIGHKLRKMGKERVKLEQCDLLYRSLNDIYDSVDAGLEISEIEKIIHDIVVNCKFKETNREDDIYYPAPDFW